MEFDYIGKHCALPTCHQKDFLPFKCDYCHESYCLEHRAYSSHGCDGGLSKDVTSADCPLCHKTIRFTKAQDANMVWEEHYLNGCSHEAKQKVHKTCGRTDCRTILGPVNTFSCSKCRLQVCISHRFPDDHNCTAVQASQRQQIASNKPSAPTTKASNSAVLAAAKKNSVTDVLRETAARRMQNRPPNPPSSSVVQPKSKAVSVPTVAAPEQSSHPAPTVNSSKPLNPKEQHVCPFYCGMIFDNTIDLSNHVNARHMESPSSVLAAQPAGPATDTILSNHGSEIVRI